MVIAEDLVVFYCHSKFDIVEIINVIRLLKECNGLWLFAAVVRSRIVRVVIAIRSKQMLLTSRHNVKKEVECVAKGFSVHRPVIATPGVHGSTEVGLSKGDGQEAAIVRNQNVIHLDKCTIKI